MLDLLSRQWKWLAESHYTCIAKILWKKKLNQPKPFKPFIIHGEIEPSFFHSSCNHRRLNLFCLVDYSDQHFCTIWLLWGSNLASSNKPLFYSLKAVHYRQIHICDNKLLQQTLTPIKCILIVSLVIPDLLLVTVSCSQMMCDSLLQSDDVWQSPPVSWFSSTLKLAVLK